MPFFEDLTGESEAVVEDVYKRQVATKRGAQPGNKNAVGHGGTGPPGNKNAVKHGAYETIYFDALPAEETVSYTHLDVYKRQTRNRVCRKTGSGGRPSIITQSVRRKSGG